MEAIFHEKVHFSVDFFLPVNLQMFNLIHNDYFLFVIQQEGSLCAQHCLNALLQGKLFLMYKTR